MPLLFLIAVAWLTTAAGLPLACYLWPSGSRGEKCALASALALGACAYAVFFFGITGHVRGGLIVTGGALLIAGVVTSSRLFRFLPLLRLSSASLIWGVVLGLFLFTSALAAMAPPLSLEWDSLAYHLALPKIWIAQNRIITLPYDHHSYFPQLTEMFFTAGHYAGGYAGAKLMHTWTSVLAVLAAAGFAARRYGASAGPWTALAVVCCPLAFWEAGTAYVDMATALYTTLAVLLLFDAKERPSLAWGAALCAGLVAATKYNGLLTIGLLAIVALAWLPRPRLAGALILFLVGLAVASPWYIRTAIDTGNPVYPFAFSVLGGKYWSTKNDEAYRAEQKSFGVGRAPQDVLRIPWDITTRPERYLNQGGLLGALGLPLVLAPFLLPASRRRDPYSAYFMAFLILNLLAWFWLSQQSRYILALAPCLAILVGRIATGALPVARQCIQVASVAQAAFIYLVFGRPWLLESAPLAFSDIHSERVEQYLVANSYDYRAALAVNSLPTASKIALYDEVKGYYFDRPYSWSNPGHHTLIPYDSLVTPFGLMKVLRLQGFTHVLVNLSGLPPDLRSAWQPMLDGEASANADLPRGTEPWRRLLAQAVQEGLLVREDADPGPGYRLFRIAAFP